MYNNDITLETSNVMWYLTCSITLFALLYTYFLTTNITHLDQLLNMWLHLNEPPLNGSFYLKWKTVSFTIYDNNKLKHSDNLSYPSSLLCSINDPTLIQNVRSLIQKTLFIVYILVLVKIEPEFRINTMTDVIMYNKWNPLFKLALPIIE